MKIHVLGICGTFMGGIALLARQCGHEVSGSDMNVYPPMSTQLSAQGIALTNGWDPAHLPADLDFVIVGNVISRGNPVMEHILEHNIPYISGPQWLFENVIRERWVLAVSGTHGKTTTTSILTWMLEYAGLKPGFLIGGIPENFGVSARLGENPYFVIEADEYDSAFFDKRSKFIHYHPKTLVLNNLEFDHADIFADLAAIKQQFRYLLRTVPGNGLIVKNAVDDNLTDVIKQGCWTPIDTFGGESHSWRAQLIAADGSCFKVFSNDGSSASLGQVNWDLAGNHNVNNALAAIAAANHAGVPVEKAIAALTTFKNVKRRLEIKGHANGITFYDDFAHHPTAIATTLAGLRARVGKEARIIVVLEFGSYTMRNGVHKNAMAQALTTADMVVCKQPVGDDWGLDQVLKQMPQPTALYDNVDTLVASLAPQLQPNDHVIIMSNSGFGGIHDKLLQAVPETAQESLL
jgi:UDP-N-acetylmuramate: L-alanyl-gamma-D-glutamyl-meso-diaminopimelate ligase